MDTRDQHRLERHARRIEELRLWRNAREGLVSDWRFSAGSGKTHDVRIGDFWPEVGVPVMFSANAKVPEGWAGLPVELELWLGGEGFVEVSVGAGRLSGGLNPFHRSFPVTESARGGEEIRVEAEVVPKGVFGSNVSEPRLTRACLVVPEEEVRALERDLTAIFETCAALDDHEVVPHLLDMLDVASTILSTSWPTASGVTLSRYLEGYTNPIGEGARGLPPHYAEKAVDIKRVMGEPWSVPDPPRPLEPLPEEARVAVRKAREVVAARLAEVKGEYPPVGSLALTGHAHLDLAWLWPVSETRRKARRTFASVLSLMDRYPEFTFNQSSAQLYEWVEEDSPDLFERVRGRVAEGRWEPVGGSWVEPDCQIPSGESFVRQLLYGQRYFQEKFGRRCRVAWLPDTFGFSPAIPQLLRGAGITGFFTYKLNWSETNEFPYDLYEWEALDGSSVIGHTFDNPGTDYNGDITPLDLLGTWRNFEGKRRHPESLFSFGWGDGGGGPSEKMLESYVRLKDFPAMPRLRMARVEEFFASLPKENLPRWVGELYLELHRGTLTTQARVKKLSRETEHRLLEAEAFAAIASLRGAEYPAEKLERLWKTLLLNQFHDILPGTSISEVYKDTHRQLEEVVESATRLRDEALSDPALADAEGTLLVANASLHARTLTVILPEDRTSTRSVSDAEGNPLPVQETGEGLLVHSPHRRVPGLGWTTLRLSNASELSLEERGVSISGAEEGVVIENELLRVEIGAEGTLHRVYDKVMEREVLGDRANQLWVYTDKPANWDAWDVQEDYDLEGEEIRDVERVEISESGPLRASILVERRWRDSTITQTYRLLAGSRRLDIETHVDWHERQTLLRALFPVNVRSHEATFETMFGALRRPTHQNTSWDVSRFEVSAHRWADISEPGYGVSLLNDGKYGHSARDSVLGISLLRGPLHPDPLADEGVHEFTYSLFPHPGDWTEAGVVEEAFVLNSPLLVAPEGSTSPDFSFVSAEGARLVLGSLKHAEDERSVILRLYEPHGARGTATLRFTRELKEAVRVNLLEEPEIGELVVEGSAVRFEARPFEVITLRLEFVAG